jgi:hypothetical protein
MIVKMIVNMTVNLITRPIASLIVGLTVCGQVVTACADTRLDAHFAISMIGVSIGQISWTAEFGAAEYTTSASGKASGALSMLVKGEGRVATRGTVGSDALMPAFFSSHVTDDDGDIRLQMSLENGAVKTLRSNEPPPKGNDRIAVTEADRRNVADPLSAMLMVAPPGENGLAPEHCDRELAVFDGQRRYDLTLSFKRLDKMKVKHGYAGPVMVCSVMLKPIAGYRADSMLVKYVAGRRGMEIWFAPVAGTSIIAPARLLMPTLIGTLEIEADRFDISTPEPAIGADQNFVGRREGGGQLTVPKTGFPPSRQ